MLRGFGPPRQPQEARRRRRGARTGAIEGLLPGHDLGGRRAGRISRRGAAPPPEIARQVFGSTRSAVGVLRQAALDDHRRRRCRRATDASGSGSSRGLRSASLAAWAVERRRRWPSRRGPLRARLDPSGSRAACRRPAPVHVRDRPDHHSRLGASRHRWRIDGRPTPRWTGELGQTEVQDFTKPSASPSGLRS